MITISLCMIVKNEEKHLAACLDCLHGLCEEIIIVDTGSTDRTKDIAKTYTDKIFDFAWTGDFSEARNFAFEKATMDYIYTADADERIDKDNQKKFADLKSVLLPEVEIVQMFYVEEGIRTVLNTNEELRPKLFKRLRTFTWIDPVHEKIRTLPVVFDSDIRIEHHPDNLHAPRDFSLIEKAYKKDGALSQDLYKMYAKEVYKWGEAEALKNASEIFSEVLSKENLAEDLVKCMFTVMARSARLEENDAEFIKNVSKVLAIEGCSEICCELGDYFLKKDDRNEAKLWYYNAIHESEPLMDADVTVHAARGA